MIVLLMVMAFIIGCVDCPCFFSNHSFWPCCYEFFTFRCMWEISFFSQMISVTVSWLLGLDRIFK